MEENGCDAERTNIANGEKPNRKEAGTQRSPVAELVAKDAAGHIPPQEQAREERAEGQEVLRREVIAEVEELHSKDLQSIDSTLRKRAENGDGAADERGNPCTASPRHVQLLIKEGCADFVHRNGGR